MRVETKFCTHQINSEMPETESVSAILLSTQVRSNPLIAGVSEFAFGAPNLGMRDRADAQRADTDIDERGAKQAAADKRLRPLHWRCEGSCNRYAKG